MLKSILAAAAVVPFGATFNQAYAQFQNGGFITYNQINWGDPASTAGVLMAAQYNTVYWPTGGILEVGIPGPGGFSMIFTDAPSVMTYMPSVGPVGQLDADLLNPTSSSSGAFGGEVMGLRLNIDFSDAGHTMGVLGIPFGNLVIHDYTKLPQVNGLHLRQVLGEANISLGGGAVGYSVSDAFALAQEINGSFEGGSPTQFAQEHLRLPCYADCNADGGLTVADFGCFQTKFVAGDPYADCNADGVLTVADFGCFQTAFVAGCP